MEIVQLNNFVSEEVQTEIDIIDKRYYQIVRFFEERTQSKLYKISPENCTENQLANELFYNLFGIYFNKEIEERKEKRYILIIPESVLTSEAALEEYIKEQEIFNGIANFHYCVIAKNLEKSFIQNLDLLKYVITKRFPNIMFLNTFLCKGNYVGRTVNSSDITGLYENFSIINITDSLISYTGNQDCSANVRDFFKLGEQLLQYCSDYSNPVFTIDNSINLTKDNMTNYYKIAAYHSAVYGMKFIIPRKDEFSSFLSYCRDLISRDKNLLEDYLLMLNNFPYFTVSLQSDVPALFIKDLDKIKRNFKDYSIKLTVQLVELNPTDLKIMSSKVRTPEIVDLNSIQIKSLSKLFKLDTQSVNFTKLNSLNDLLCEYAKMYKQRFNFDALHLFNNTSMLCFESNGKLYFGYVSAIEGKIPFIVQPLNSRIKPFKLDKKISDISYLYDINLVHDIDNLINRFVYKYPIYNNIKMWHYRYANIKGISMLFNVNKEQQHATDNCGLTIAEAGLWDINCDVFKDIMSSLGKVLNEEKLLERSILTYFGCTHPYFSPGSSNKTTISISADLWK